MSRRERGPAAGAAREQAPARTPLLWVVIAFALLLPLFVTPGQGMFRTPKDLLVRFEAIVLLALVAITALLIPGRWNWRELARERWLWLAGAVVSWSAVCAVLSVNRIVSAFSLAWITSMAVVFAVSVLAMRSAPIAAAAAPLFAGIVNVAVVLLQYLRIWSPYPAPDGASVRATGLIGQSTDLGSYLMIPALGAVALALTSKRWRIPAAAAAVLLTAGTFLTAALTAVGALAAGLVVIAAMRSFRLVVAVLLIVTLLAGAAVAFVGPVRARYDRMSEAVAAGDWDRIFSFRFVGFITAWMMLRDHPITGVGPGAYGTEFLDYRERAEADFPSLTRSGARLFNFGEAHNDHLQVAAQTGVPGFLLFAGALVMLGSVSRRRAAPNEESKFAKVLALPLAVAFGVLALAQFPLELAAPLHTALYYAAALVAWSGRP